jgi:hypothetical protein
MEINDLQKTLVGNQRLALNAVPANPIGGERMDRVLTPRNYLQLPTGRCRRKTIFIAPIQSD